MQPGKKRQTRLHSHHHIGWKDKLHSCEFVAVEVGQDIQSKSTQPSQVAYHTDKHIQLFFYPVHADVTWRKTLRTCVS